jgi:hypothetical protein
MKRFIAGENRFQSTLFRESLDDYIAQDNAVRVVDAFVSKLDLKALGFNRVEEIIHKLREPNDLLDFMPEAIALGAVFGARTPTRYVLAILIRIQKLPEGFNSYRELIAQ